MYREYFKYTILSFVRTQGESRNMFLLSEIGIKRCVKQNALNGTKKCSHQPEFLINRVCINESLLYLN